MRGEIRYIILLVIRRQPLNLEEKHEVKFASITHIPLALTFLYPFGLLIDEETEIESLTCDALHLACK